MKTSSIRAIELPYLASVGQPWRTEGPAEYEVDCTFNGKPYKQLYMGRLVAENGKIKLVREGMNMYPVIKIFGQ